MSGYVGKKLKVSRDNPMMASQHVELNPTEMGDIHTLLEGVVATSTSTEGTRALERLLQGCENPVFKTHHAQRMTADRLVMAARKVLKGFSEPWYAYRSIGQLAPPAPKVEAPKGSPYPSEDSNGRKVYLMEVTGEERAHLCYILGRFKPHYAGGPLEQARNAMLRKLEGLSHSPAGAPPAPKPIPRVGQKVKHALGTGVVIPEPKEHRVSEPAYSVWVLTTSQWGPLHPEPQVVACMPDSLAIVP